MKNPKFKSSLLITTLISTSLFGSKSNPGGIQLPPEKEQEIAQIITREEVLPPLTKNLLSSFNTTKQVLALKETYNLNQKNFNEIRISFGKAMAQKSNERIMTPMKLNKQAAQTAIKEYETVFKTELKKALQEHKFTTPLEFFYLFTAPYIRYSAVNLILPPANPQMFLSYRQKIIEILQQFDPEFVQIAVFEPINAPIFNPYIKILQECSLEIIKHIDSMRTFYLEIRFINANNNYKQKCIDLTKYTETSENLHKELEVLETEGKEIDKEMLAFLVCFCKNNGIKIPEKVNDIKDMYTLINENSQAKKKLEINATFTTIHNKLINNAILIAKKGKNLTTTLNKTLTFSSEVEKAREERDQAFMEFSDAQQLINAQTQQKTVKKKSTQKPKYGRKAIPTSSSSMIQVSQKQKKQALKIKTLEELEAKFGEDLDKEFDKLEIITFDFDTKDDWNTFVKEKNVELSGIPYRHGSHESQEIFFDFEGQKTKGQLLTYHVHGQDAPEKITRQIRVTRRVQK